MRVSICAVAIAGSVLMCSFAPAESAEEANKRVAAEYMKEVWQNHKSTFVEQVTTEDFDRTAAIAFSDTVFVQYPDFRLEVLDMIAEGDKVAVQWQCTGTSAMAHSNGKQVSFGGMSMMRFEDGKMAENVSHWNQWTIMQQLGFAAVPPQEGAAETATEE